MRIARHRPRNHRLPVMLNLSQYRREPVPRWIYSPQLHCQPRLALRRRVSMGGGSELGCHQRLWLGLEPWAIRQRSCRQSLLGMQIATRL